MKNIKWLLLALTLFIAGCAQPQAQETPTEQAKPVEETTIESEIDSEPVEVAVQGPYLSEQQYRDEVGTISLELSSYMTDFSELNMQASTNPVIIYTDDWTYDTAVAIVGIRDCVAAFRSLQAPPHLQPSHDEILLAMDEFEQSTVKYTNAIDNDNWDLLDEALEHLNKGGEHVGNATILLNGGL